MDWVLPLLSGVGSICAIIFGVSALLRNRKSDTSADAKQDATVLTELGYIKGGIEDIKTEQREQRKTNTDFVTRLTAVEASAKQAHRRLDRMEHGYEQEGR